MRGGERETVCTSSRPFPLSLVIIYAVAAHLNHILNCAAFTDNRLSWKQWRFFLSAQNNTASPLKRCAAATAANLTGGHVLFPTRQELI